MTDKIVAFTVYGIPCTQGNKTAYPFRRKDGTLGVNLVEGRRKKSQKAFKKWREEVSARALQWVLENVGIADGGIFTGATELTLRFYVPVPKYCQKGFRYPIKRPDLLKYARLAEDALTGIIYLDDSQNVDTHIKKRYAYTDDGPRVEVSVREKPNGDEL